MSDDAPQLNAANIDNGLIRLDWSDTTSSIFHPMWLRDNCRCESCGDNRLSKHFDIMPRTLTADPDQLSVTWHDDAQCDAHPCNDDSAARRGRLNPGPGTRVFAMLRHASNMPRSKPTMPACCRFNKCETTGFDFLQWRTDRAWRFSFEPAHHCRPSGACARR